VSDKPAHWIVDEAKKKEGVEVELLDLRDYPMPFFDAPVSPQMMKDGYPYETVRNWAAKIKEGDAFIVIAPEYNHGYTAVLKNALDWIYGEWNKKAVGFVSYGSAGGARSVEQLRQVVIDLQMLPIRNSIHLPADVFRALFNEPVPANPEVFAPVRAPVDRVELFLEELIWAGRTLRAGREEME